VPPNATGPVTIEIVAPNGVSMRRAASTDVPHPVDPKDVPFPAYWIVTPQPPAATPGMHRFVWDFRIGTGEGPLAAPGRYTVRATIAGRTFARPLVLRRDPRIHASDADLVAQTNFALTVDRLRATVRAALADAAKARAAKPSLAARIDAIAGSTPGSNPEDSMGAALRRDTTSLRADARFLAELEFSIETADAPPNATERDAWRTLSQRATRKVAALEAVLKSGSRTR
jgi:hypothetical protein